MVSHWLDSFCVLAVLALCCAPSFANDLPLLENGQRIGTVRYEARDAGSPANAAYILKVAQSVLAARRSLAAMEFPLDRQPRDFVVEVTDLGPDRLGLATIDGRMRVTTRARLADPGEDVSARLKGTVAHEYFHLCQYACWSDLAGAQENQYLWWMEACAIYFEHRVAPRDRKTGRKLNTYDDALPEARGAHEREGLESPTAGSNLGYCYAPLAFIMAKGYGPQFLARTWLRLGEARDRPLTAMQSIEATLAELGAGDERSRFDRVFREYVLYMMTPSSRYLRAEMGLDVIAETPVTMRLDTVVELPGWSFKVYAPRGAQGIAAQVEAGEGIRAYLVGVEDDHERVERIDGRAALELARGGSGWLVVVNASPGSQRARVVLSPETSPTTLAVAAN